MRTTLIEYRIFQLGHLGILTAAKRDLHETLFAQQDPKGCSLSSNGSYSLHPTSSRRSPGQAPRSDCRPRRPMDDRGLGSLPRRHSPAAWHCRRHVRSAACAAIDLARTHRRGSDAAPGRARRRQRHALGHRPAARPARWTPSSARRYGISSNPTPRPRATRLILVPGNPIIGTRPGDTAR
jgi:hypothetical protein